MAPERLAAYLRLFRADSIVADAEIARARIAGGARWDTLGQSYGGFITLTYLSRAPQGLRTCYVTGGLPGITATVDDWYARTYPRVAARNAEYYRHFPQDAAALRRLADHLEEHEVLLPDGDRLTARRLRFLGNSFGMSDGYATVHWLLDEAWHGDDLADGFRYAVMAATGFVDTPIAALQEFTSTSGGAATGWARRAGPRRPPGLRGGRRPAAVHRRDDVSLDVPGDRRAEAVRRGRRPAGRLDDWPPLYDPRRWPPTRSRSARRSTSTTCTWTRTCSCRTAAAMGNTRVWVTNEYEHNGLRLAGDVILDRLMGMAAGRL